MLHRPKPTRRRMPRQGEPRRILTVAVVDVAVYIASFVSPLMTLPQVYQIYAYQDATGVSALSWGAYTLFSIPWLSYGILHREKPLIIANSLWLVLHTTVFVGALLY